MQINKIESDRVIGTMTQKEVDYFIKIGLIKKEDIIEEEIYE